MSQPKLHPNQEFTTLRAKTIAALKPSDRQRIIRQVRATCTRIVGWFMAVVVLGAGFQWLYNAVLATYLPANGKLAYVGEGFAWIALMAVVATIFIASQPKLLIQDHVTKELLKKHPKFEPVHQRQQQRYLPLALIYIGAWLALGFWLIG